MLVHKRLYISFIIKRTAYFIFKSDDWHVVFYITIHVFVFLAVKRNLVMISMTSEVWYMCYVNK